MNKQIPVALGIIVNDKQEFLLTLRNDPENPSMHQKWELPGGGIEKGETGQQAVIREIKEEIGVEVSILPYPPFTLSIVHDTAELVFTCFLCRIDRGVVVPDMKEALDFRWITLAELDSLDYLPRLDEMLEKALVLLKQK